MENLKPKILIPEIDDRENFTMNTWLKALGNFLASNPDDNTFRMMMNRDNELGLWANRPYELARLDLIQQVWPHLETLGNHTHSVIQNLNTEVPIGGKNYLADPKRKGMIKALRAAAIFHDIAKMHDVGDQKHPLHSAQMVESFFKAMNFTEYEAWLCQLLIKNHDLIGKAVNRNDPTEVDLIVRKCHDSPAILQCLRAITIADISSITELQKTVNYNILSDVEMAVKLALAEIERRKNGKVKKTIILPPKKEFNF
jgi:UTP:GlnB (protein PII) uridylyltransferase